MSLFSGGLIEKEIDVTSVFESALVNSLTSCGKISLKVAMENPAIVWVKNDLVCDLSNGNTYRVYD